MNRSRAVGTARSIARAEAGATRRRGARWAALAAVCGLAACATVKTPSPEDPFEGFNRTVFQFNDALDKAVLKPAAQAYNWALPQFARTAVANFFSNVDDAYIAANNFAQGKITDGTEDVMRVAINTVFGLGGLIDVASQARLPKHQQDFGLTLGHYGVAPGPYLVLPLFGPSTVRDTAGLVVDHFADPLGYVDPTYLRITLYGIHVVSKRAALLQASDLLANAALDKYSFVRSAYLQRRNYLIHDGDTPAPDYGDDGALPNYGAAPAAGASTAEPAAAASAPVGGNNVPGPQLPPPPPGNLPTLRLK